MESTRQKNLQIKLPHTRWAQHTRDTRDNHRESFNIYNPYLCYFIYIQKEFFYSRIKYAHFRGTNAVFMDAWECKYWTFFLLVCECLFNLHFIFFGILFYDVSTTSKFLSWRFNDFPSWFVFGCAVAELYRFYSWLCAMRLMLHNVKWFIDNFHSSDNDFYGWRYLPQVIWIITIK